MDEQMDTGAIPAVATLGLLLAPLAVLLALATTRVVGIEYDLTMNNMMLMLVVAIASMLAMVPRLVLAQPRPVLHHRFPRRAGVGLCWCRSALHGGRC